MAVYKYVLEKDVFIQTNILGREFIHRWFVLDEHGLVCIKKGYAWDGCSPKIVFTDLIMGTPDGKMHDKTKKPITYHASLIHDVIYQFKDIVPISRKEADNVFLNELKQKYFFWANTYYFFVRTFGWIYGEWRIN